MDHFLSKAHGRTSFSAEHEPVLRVRPGTGEVIGFETNDAEYEEMDRFKDLDKVTTPFNPVTGPVHVEGAQPGDALAVTVHGIDFKEYGWSVSIPGSGALMDVMGEEIFTRRIPIDEAGAHLTDTHVVPLAPMIGCIGTAPATGGNDTVMPSYAEGGNIDITDVGPGSTVYLPVRVEGAYLFVGDLHAVMAQGESTFVAIETEGVAKVSVDVVKDLPLRAPRIETATEWIFVGIGDTVQESIKRGYEDAFCFLTQEHGFSKEDTYVLMSATVHSQLGGPTGSQDPDPLHPFQAIGSVTIHRVPKSIL